jgi:hypothetical protein
MPVREAWSLGAREIAGADTSAEPSRAIRAPSGDSSRPGHPLCFFVLLRVGAGFLSCRVAWSNAASIARGFASSSAW